MSAISKFRVPTLFVLLTVAACGGSASGTTLANANPEAKAVFESLCFTCHGGTGHGDGPGAAALQPKPRSFADASWQESVNDAHIKKVIVYGGAPAGKSAQMPAHPQLKGKNDVLEGLVEIVRGFRPRT